MLARLTIQLIWVALVYAEGYAGGINISLETLPLYILPYILNLYEGYMAIRLMSLLIHLIGLWKLDKKARLFYLYFIFLTSPYTPTLISMEFVRMMVYMLNSYVVYILLYDYGVDVKQLSLSKITLENRRKEEVIQSLNQQVDLLLEEFRFRSYFSSSFFDQLSDVLLSVESPLSMLLNEKKSMLDYQVEKVEKLHDEFGRLGQYVERCQKFLSIYEDDGYLQKNPTPFYLDEMVDSIIRSVAVYVPKSVDLTFNIDAKVPLHVMGDMKAMFLIVEKLLRNAIRFTDVGDISLRIRLDPSPGRRAPQDSDWVHLLVSVHDTGVGIPQRYARAIFDPIDTAPRHHGRRGNGLALPLIRVLVTGCFMGNISVVSQEGRGSKFIFQASLRKVKRGSMLNKRKKMLKRLSLGIWVSNWMVQEQLQYLLSGSSCSIVSTPDELSHAISRLSIVAIVLDGKAAEEIAKKPSLCSQMESSGCYSILLAHSSRMDALSKMYPFLSKVIPKPLQRGRLLDVVLHSMRPRRKPTDRQTPIEVLLVEGGACTKDGMEPMLNGFEFTHSPAGKSPFQVSTVADRVEDVKRLVEAGSGFELVLLDRHSRLINKLGVLKALRDRNKPCAVVALQGSGNADERLPGVDRVLSAPIDVDAFMVLLASHFPTLAISSTSPRMTNSLLSPRGERKQTGIRVFVIHTNPVNLHILVNVLERGGIEVTPANQGQEAIDLFARDSERFQIVILDENVTLFSAAVLVHQFRTIRGTGKGKELYIILLHSDTELDPELMKQVDHCMPKPTNYRDLLEHILLYASTFYR